MKKIKFIAAVVGLSLMILFIACSTPNSNDNPKKTNPTSGGTGSGAGSGDGGGSGSGGNGGNPAGGTTVLPYTVLPFGTIGSAGPSNNTTITYVEFGSWPQTKKTDNTITMSTTTSTVNGWTVYTGSDSKYYVLEGGNYYKIEPIRWRILTDSYDHDANNTTSGKKLLLAEKILIPLKYYDNSNARTIGTTEVNPNNYEHSKIRAYLNGRSYTLDTGEDSSFSSNNCFLKFAFTDTEQNAIATTKVVNNAVSANPDVNESPWNSGNNPYASNKMTEDKLFLLSEQEVTKSNYQFAAYNSYDSTPVVYGTGNKRIRLTTDYAKDKGAWQSSLPGLGGFWWLRSPSYDSNNYSRGVNDNGSANSDDVVTSSIGGVVPALCLN